MRRALLAVTVAAALAASAPAAGAERERFTSVSFGLKSSAEQQIYVTGARHHVLLGVEGRRTAINYLERGVVTASRLRARFGPFGSVAMNFTPDHERFQPAPEPCDGGTRIQSGTFRGSFEFAGDDGYEGTSARSAKGTVARTRIRCDFENPVGVAPAENRGGRATFLDAENGGAQFSAIQEDEKRHALFYANVNGREAGVRIIRSAFAQAPSDRFSFNQRRREANVEPPQPFTGTAALAGTEWSGDLAVAFPGGPTVALAGPDFRASLTRGVLITFLKTARAVGRELAQLAR